HHPYRGRGIRPGLGAGQPPPGLRFRTRRPRPALPVRLRQRQGKRARRRCRRGHRAALLPRRQATGLPAQRPRTVRAGPGQRQAARAGEGADRPAASARFEPAVRLVAGRSLDRLPRLGAAHVPQRAGGIARRRPAGRVEFARQHGCRRRAVESRPPQPVFHHGPAHRGRAHRAGRSAAAYAGVPRGPLPGSVQAEAGRRQEVRGRSGRPGGESPGADRRERHSRTTEPAAGGARRGRGADQPGRQDLAAHRRGRRQAESVQLVARSAGEGAAGGDPAHQHTGRKGGCPVQPRWQARVLPRRRQDPVAGAGRQEQARGPGRRRRAGSGFRQREAGGVRAGLGLAAQHLPRSGHARDALEPGARHPRAAGRHGDVAGGIKRGDYLLAIDGEPLDAGSNLAERLAHRIGEKVSLRIADDAGGAHARDVAVKPVDSHALADPAYRAWTATNRAYVLKASGGRLGYVHLRDMSSESLQDFYKDLDAQNATRDGVVIDIRNNFGGFVNAYALDVLSRRPYLNMTFRGFDKSEPARSILGQRALERPTVLITNRVTLSDGEDFSEGYRALGLGKIVGEPTAGWIIYTSAGKLIDGGTVRLPFITITDNHGQPMEGHPRPVDIPVSRALGESFQGRDSELDAAVRSLLGALGKLTPPTS